MADRLHITEVVLREQPLIAPGFVFRPVRGLKISFYKSMGILLENSKGKEFIPWPGVRGVRLGEEPMPELK